MDTSTIFENKTNPNIPPLAPGDTVKVSAKIAERGKERTQVFQGVVIKLRRGADGGSFTIRKVSRGIGVEHTFPFASPRVEKVEVTRHGKVRRAKLYYLRGLSSKAARTKERQVKEQVKDAKEPEVKEAKEAQE
jgi:large subunit ribosomal protein L19